MTFSIIHLLLALPSVRFCTVRTSLTLIFISVHARFILQLQQSGILSLLLFVRLKPQTRSENILQPIFSSLHLIAPSD